MVLYSIGSPTPCSPSLSRTAILCAWSKRRWNGARLSVSSRGCAANDRRRRDASSARLVRTAYSWPGNVRELENAIERAVAFARGPVITPHDLPERVGASGGASALIARSVEQNMTVREVEREYILEVLRRTGGAKSRAAELLGLDRKTLYRRLDEYRADGVPVP